MSFLETITPWDASVLQSIQGIKCDFLDTFMAVMSFLGEKGLIWIILGLTLCLFKKTRATGVIMLCAMILGLLLGEFGIKKYYLPPPSVCNLRLYRKRAYSVGLQFSVGTHNLVVCRCSGNYHTQRKVRRFYGCTCFSHCVFKALQLCTLSYRCNLRRCTRYCACNNNLSYI